jgi:uncharacterized DUF497 family protein
VIYEWDPQKAAANVRKHRVSFEEAASVFLDPLAVTYPDPDHSAEEFREITIGHSANGKSNLLSHMQRGNRIRIISARKLTRSERKQYEEITGKDE